jgi:hypothetical protein
MREANMTVAVVDRRAASFEEIGAAIPQRWIRRLRAFLRLRRQTSLHRRALRDLRAVTSDPRLLEEAGAPAARPEPQLGAVIFHLMSAAE